MGKMPWLIRVARLTYGKILIKQQQATLVNECNADLKNGTYLYIINHVGFYDPMLVSSIMPSHIRWVAGAYLFKNPFLKLVLGKGCTAIPKQQGRSDLSTIRNMQNALKNGDNVGIFPEGTRTWDGEMMPLAYRSLAKMLRIFKVPVLFVHLEGGFAAQPRWSAYKRKGKVTVNVKHLLTPEELAKTDVETLTTKVEEYMHFSNDEWKETVDYNYPCPARAEGIQRLFYMCPCCKKVDVLKGEGNTIKCTSCGASAVVTEKDDIQSSDISFKQMRQWHAWEAAEISKKEGLASEPGVLFQIGDANNDGKLRTISEDITVKIEDNAIVVDCKSLKTKSDEKHYVLALDKISSLILNAKQTIELFCEDVLYRIRLDADSSSLKYHEYYLGYINSKAKEVN
ncbi:MAG: 1-acyl-sn-glycerol-3-phosphate acyltransferase [Sphaerochaetaceae bacterium]|nr:1-acyl-sn-glycerol-3-phosphate acyltransferase [Sphaerochaetaceae bacterium]